MKRARLVARLAAVAALLWATAARASNYALEEIPNVVPVEAANKLKGAGISTTFQLLEKCADPQARRDLSRTLKIAERTLEGWVQMADILRIKGVGPDVTRLLAAAGVHTVAQLKTQDPTKLDDEIMKVNSRQHLSENPPSVEHLQAWIAQAQSLPIVLH